MPTTLKNEAAKLVSALPENATWDDLMYEIYVKQKIEAGLEALKQGKTISHNEIKQRFSDQ